MKVENNRRKAAAMLQKVLEFLRATVQVAALILAWPIIVVAMIICARDEDRTIRALAADANMTVAEYLEAEWQRDEYAVSKLFK